jgi:hypothetical protein
MTNLRFVLYFFRAGEIRVLHSLQVTVYCPKALLEDFEPAHWIYPAGQEPSAITAVPSQLETAGGAQIAERTAEAYPTP